MSYYTTLNGKRINVLEKEVFKGDKIVIDFPYGQVVYYVTEITRMTESICHALAVTDDADAPLLQVDEYFTKNLDAAEILKNLENMKRLEAIPADKRWEINELIRLVGKEIPKELISEGMRRSLCPCCKAVLFDSEWHENVINRHRGHDRCVYCGQSLKR